MDEKSAAEKAAVGREARNAVAGRPVTSGSGARQDALRRFLGAESYHEKRVEETEDGTAHKEES